MSFLDEVLAKLVADGVGVFGTDLFISSKSVTPIGDGPFLTLTETGGMAPTRINNKPGASTQRPTAQIMVKASSYPAARTMALAAYNSLDGIWNTELSGTFYQKVIARQEPTDLGLEEGTARVRIAFNIEAEKAPS